MLSYGARDAVGGLLFSSGKLLWHSTGRMGNKKPLQQERECLGLDGVAFPQAAPRRNVSSLALLGITNGAAFLSGARL